MAACLAGVHPRARLDHLTQHHGIDSLGRQPGTPEGLAHHRRTQCGGRGLLQRTAKGTNGCAHRRTKDYVRLAHGNSLS